MPFRREEAPDVNDVPTGYYILLPASFLALLAFSCWMGARRCGWRELAEAYRDQMPFEASQSRVTQATVMRSWRLSGGVPLRVGMDRQSLYLRTWPIPLPGFTPLRVPSGDVTMKRRRVFFFDRCELRFRQRAEVVVLIKERVMQGVVEAAGGAWGSDGRLVFRT
jgi:hypothetical protein